MEVNQRLTFAQPCFDEWGSIPISLPTDCLYHGFFTSLIGQLCDFLHRPFPASARYIHVSPHAHVSVTCRVSLSNQRGHSSSLDWLLDTGHSSLMLPQAPSPIPYSYATSEENMPRHHHLYLGYRQLHKKLPSSRRLSNGTDERTKLVPARRSCWPTSINSLINYY